MKIFAIVASTVVLFGASPAWSQAQETAKGAVLVDANKRTLYTFDKDTGGKSTCNGPCAETWPPYADKVDAYAGQPGKWSVITRDDGSKMWAHDGKPVYYFKDDKAPGDVKGDGVNGVWHAAKP